jgi:hypothetical protein
MALQSAAAISGRDLIREGMDGAQIGDALRHKRLQAISRFKSEYQSADAG